MEENVKEIVHGRLEGQCDALAVPRRTHTIRAAECTSHVPARAPIMMAIVGTIALADMRVLVSSYNLVEVALLHSVVGGKGRNHAIRIVARPAKWPEQRWPLLSDAAI